MNIIPVINCPDKACVEKTLATAKTFLQPGDLIHIDVTDGIFSSHKTLNDPNLWATIGSAFPLEVHLMMDYPIDHLDTWFTAGAQRAIVHVETIFPSQIHAMREIARHHGGELMLSMKPDTDLDFVLPFLTPGEDQAFQVLAVQPGVSGQYWDPAVANKIVFLREIAPNATIEVDGGMNPETARIVRTAGADTIVSSSYIFNSPDPKLAYETLKNI